MIFLDPDRSEGSRRPPDQPVESETEVPHPAKEAQTAQKEEKPSKNYEKL